MRLDEVELEAGGVDTWVLIGELCRWEVVRIRGVVPMGDGTCCTWKM